MINKGDIEKSERLSRFSLGFSVFVFLFTQIMNAIVPVIAFTIVLAILMVVNKGPLNLDTTINLGAYILIYYKLIDIEEKGER